MEKTEIIQLKKDLKKAGVIVRSAKVDDLKYIQLKIRKNDVEITATDNFRLFSIKCAIAIGYKTGKYYLHYTKIDDFIKKLETKKKVKLKQGIKYPDMNVIKKPKKYNIMVDTNELKRTLKMIKDMFKPSGFIEAYFRVKNGKMVIWGKNDLAKVRNELEIKEGKMKYGHFCVNADYMLSLLDQKKELTSISYEKMDLPLLVNGNFLMLIRMD